MRTLSTRDEILDAEQLILRSLCQQPFTQGQRKEMMRTLAGYAWRSAEHQVLFEVLHQPPMAAEMLREELPAILTRKGFPDMDFASYLDGRAATAAEALDTARALAARGSVNE